MEELTVKEQYFEWLMTPPKLRDPKSKRGFSDRYRISRTSLWKWEKEPEFAASLDAERIRLGVNNYAMVIGELLEIVKSDGSAAQNKINAARVLMDVLDMKTSKTVEKDKTVKLSAGQKAELLEALKDDRTD